MHCIKTGFHGFIVDYSQHVYGDAFVLTTHDASYRRFQDFARTGDSVLLLRICQREYQPISPAWHIRVEQTDHWFDDGFTSPMRNSTLIAMPSLWAWLGYDGVELTKGIEDA